MSLEHWMPKLNPALFEPLRAMSEPNPKTTLREFQEYLDLSYESPREFAARIGVAKETVWYWLSGRRQPKAMSLAKLRRFLDNEAKRPAQSDGIRPIETVTLQNNQATSASSVRSALPVLPESPGQDS
jgi:transcriptional regulator with XRE-family HTH domain